MTRDGDAESDDETDEPVPGILKESYLMWMYSAENPPHVPFACQGSNCSTRPEDGAVPNGCPTAHRCRECFGNGLLCRPCIVRAHSTLPFHRVDRWAPHPDPGYADHWSWQRVTLRELGQRLHLEHNGQICPNAFDTGATVLTVGHTNAIHRVDVAYCRCEDTPPLFVQLLRHGLFPATSECPETAFTFEVLKHYIRCQLTAQISMNDYFRNLQDATDAIRPERVRVRPLRVLGCLALGHTTFTSHRTVIKRSVPLSVNFAS